MDKSCKLFSLFNSILIADGWLVVKHSWSVGREAGGYVTDRLSCGYFGLVWFRDNLQYFIIIVHLKERVNEYRVLEDNTFCMCLDMLVMLTACCQACVEDAWEEWRRLGNMVLLYYLFQSIQHSIGHVVLCI